MNLFQQAGPLPEGLMIIILMAIIIVAQGVMIYLLMRRNISLADDNREITKDAIKGFESIIDSLNSIRSELQVSGNYMATNYRDMERTIKETHREIISHLQYLRDKSR